MVSGELAVDVWDQAIQYIVSSQHIS